MEIVDLIFGFVEKFPGWPWPVCLVIWFGLIFSLLVFHLSLGVRRRPLWKRTAMVLGFVHHDEDTSLPNTLNSLDSFLDVDGFQTRSLDVLSSEADGVQKWLLDHATGTSRKLRTACVMRTSELQVSHFKLLAIGGSLRRREEQVSFQEDPDFSRIFMLTTDNPPAIKRLFDPMLRQHFVRLFHRCRELEKSNTDWLDVLMLRLSSAIGYFEVEVANDTLSVHLSRIINPRGAPEFLALTTETLQILKGQIP